MKLLIGGQWVEAVSGRQEEVTSPFDGSVVGSVSLAGLEDVDAALAAATEGAKVWRRTPAHQRMRILLQAAALADERAEAIAQTISAEAGKAITEARGEASRSGELIRLAAFEGTQLYGDSLPLDANPGTGFDKVGFTVRQPVGVVVAITPFNYPSLLVLHKVAPALAAGNAVVLKPARTTPLTALALAACFVDAGLPEGVLSVLTGSGGELGDALVSDPRVNKISFTGSTATGTRITQLAGVKKLSLELGASCPVVVLPDADIDAAAAAVALGGFVNAGQVCISVQRVITHPKIAGDFLDALVPRVQKISTGDPGSTDTGMGTLITQQEAERVERSIRAAVQSGATLLTGGERDGAIISPAVVSGVDPDVTVQPGRAVRARGRGVDGSGLAVRDRAGQRHRLRAGRRDLHLGRLGCGAGHPGDRRRHHPHQLDPAVARRPDALRRSEGQRHRQGRPAFRGRRDDRCEDRHPARPSLVGGPYPASRPVVPAASPASRLPTRSP